MPSKTLTRSVRVFQPDEIIFSEYEPGNTFYLIQSGKVKLVKNAGEFERTLDILQPPEMFGEMAILEDSPRTASAITIDTVKVMELTTQNFESLLRDNPQLAFKLLRIFSKRIYDSKRRFMILTLPDVQAKVADVFLMLHETIPDIEKTEDRCEIMATPEDIAHWAGISESQARETLNLFINQHRITMHSDRIVIKNMNDFTRFVNSRRNR